MPITYLCRKCAKNYSKEEYAQSKFCQSCGSFLLPNFSVQKQDLQSQSEAAKSFPERSALSRAAESLRQRVGESKEYTVVPETAKEEPKKPAFESWMWSSEYDEALKFEKKLLEQYKGKSLEEAIPGKTVSNQQGECYTISASCASTFKLASYEESREHLISDLKVLSGIGPVGEHALKRQGYATVQDLVSHPRWNKQASDFMKMIDKKEVDSTQKWLWQRLPKSHPLLALFSGVLPR